LSIQEGFDFSLLHGGLDLVQVAVVLALPARAAAADPADDRRQLLRHVCEKKGEVHTAVHELGSKRGRVNWP